MIMKITRLNYITNFGFEMLDQRSVQIPSSLKELDELSCLRGRPQLVTTQRSLYQVLMSA